MTLKVQEDAQLRGFYQQGSDNHTRESKIIMTCIDNKK